jgi:two-component sensor histidine kinase
MVSSIEDITERIKNEESIRLHLEEKELLLREVHHRVKNNMTTIISLLSLQAANVRTPEASSALADAENRMRGMMLLYDRLYRAEHFDSMPADQFIVPLVRDAAGLFPNASNITVNTPVEPPGMKAVIEFEIPPPCGHPPCGRED